MTEPWQLTAVEAAAAVRERRLSSVELTRGLLERIEALEGQLAAWVTIDAEGALAAARVRDRQAAAGEWLGPLHGIPIGVKDIIAVARLPNRAAFQPYARSVPAFDATIVERLRAAGAIVLGKTVTTQFAYVDPPPTANAWDLSRTPGGSSSGSAVAVGARLAPIALGTQTVGSVLRPAAYNGVVGFKPTYGRVSRYGILPLAWSLDHPGWICRSVEDAALVLRAVAERDHRDPTTTSRAVGPAADAPAPPRLVLIRDFVERSADQVQSHLRSVAERLRAAGAQIEEASLPGGTLDLALAVQHIILLVEAANVHASQLDRHFEQYAPILRADLQVGTVIPGVAYLQAQRLRRKLREQVLGRLGDADAFLTPTISDEAPDRSTTGDRVPQAPWSLFGFPAITLPSGLSQHALPLAIQLVGRQWDDARVLDCARWCEQALNPIGAPPLAAAAIPAPRPDR